MDYENDLERLAYYKAKMDYYGAKLELEGSGNGNSWFGGLFGKKPHPDIVEVDKVDIKLEETQYVQKCTEIFYNNEYIKAYIELKNRQLEIETSIKNKKKLKLIKKKLDALQNELKALQKQEDISLQKAKNFTKDFLKAIKSKHNATIRNKLPEIYLSEEEKYKMYGIKS